MACRGVLHHLLGQPYTKLVLMGLTNRYNVKSVQH